MSKNYKPVIAAIVGALVLALVVVGLNFAGFIRLPFLPKSPEIALLRALDDVSHDGKIDLVANGDTDAELSLGALGQEATGNIRLAATATGTLCDFDVNDLYKMNIPDGSFTTDFTLGVDVGILEGETDNLHASGTFDLAVAEGEINYNLQEPLQHSGTIRFDPHALLGDEKKAMRRSIALSDIYDMKMEGDVITFTVSTASFDTSDIPKTLKEILITLGVDVVDEETNLSDLDVSVDLGTAGLVSAHATGTLNIKASGVKRVDLPVASLSIPLNTELEINVPIDVELMLS